MHTHDTAVQVCGVLWCAKIHYHTCTHATHFGNTAGLPIPVFNPNWAIVKDLISVLEVN